MTRVTGGFSGHARLRPGHVRFLKVVFVTGSLACFGRSNLGVGAAAGLADALNFTEFRADFLGLVFILGCFFQTPAVALGVNPLPVICLVDAAHPGT